MDKVIISYDGVTYEAKYNKLSGYYEAMITGGAFPTKSAVIKYIDLVGNEYELTKAIDVYTPKAKPVDSIFMCIFDYQNLEMKDVVELIDDYEINIDEETNAFSTVNTIKETKAKADDIVIIKRNEEVIYWGIIDKIELNNEIYQYTLKYILNLFDKQIPLSHNTSEGIDDGTFNPGWYVIKSGVDPNKVIDVYGAQKSDKINVQIWTRNNTDAQLWYIDYDKINNVYTFKARCSNKMMDIEDQQIKDCTNIYQYEPNDTEAQKYIIQNSESPYVVIRSHKNPNYSVDCAEANPREGNNIWLYHNNGTIAQKWILERIDELDIKDRYIGIEGHLKNMIEQFWINHFTKDYVEKIAPYPQELIHLEVNAKTNTPKNITISGVNDNQYNLKTWMNNCTKLYNIQYEFNIKSKIIELQESSSPTIEVNCNTLVLDIKNEIKEKQLIDTTAENISNYEETFDTNIVSCVFVFTNTGSYKLVLKNDRTTVEDDETDRAKGRTEYLYTEKYEDAEQKALDIMQSNRYNHNIAFDRIGELIPIGTPVMIKTKKGDVVDTYVSAIRITKSKAISYTFGNIRTNFLDKIKKERENG